MILKLETTLADPNTKTDARNLAQTHLDKLQEFAFLCLLVGMTDLLEHVKDVSLVQQTVNILPWEVMRKEDELISLMDRIPEDYFDKGKIPPSFPLLTSLRAELETGHFHGKKLSLQANIRATHRKTPAMAFKYLLKFKLSKWCDIVHQHLVARFIDENTSERSSPTPYGPGKR